MQFLPVPPSTTKIFQQLLEDSQSRTNPIQLVSKPMVDENTVGTLRVFS